MTVIDVIKENFIVTQYQDPPLVSLPAAKGEVLEPRPVYFLMVRSTQFSGKIRI